MQQAKYVMKDDRNVNKIALVLIDIQNDFVSWTIQALPIIPRLKTVLDSCRANNIPVIHVIRHYNEDASNVEGSRVEVFKRKPFVVAGTPGAQIVPELSPLVGEPVIIKTRWSGFFKTDLLFLLEKGDIKTIVVGGLFTPNCVRATVFDAISNNLNVIVLEDGTASEGMDIQNGNILDMINVGVRMMRCSQFLKTIEYEGKT